MSSASGWSKSSFSGTGNCVEVQPGQVHVVVRDSKDPSGPWLRFTSTEWAAFLDGVRAGEFDL